MIAGIPYPTYDPQPLPPTLPACFMIAASAGQPGSPTSAVTPPYTRLNIHDVSAGPRGSST